MAEEKSEPRDDAQPSKQEPPPKEPLPSRSDPRLVREREANDQSPRINLTGDGRPRVRGDG